MALLRIGGLTRSFYGVQALKGLDLEVRAGTITGLIGPNGAGKTTAFNVISGLVPADAGRISFDGRTSPAGGRTGSPPPGWSAPSRSPAASPG